MSLLNEAVLVLNRLWQPTAETSVQTALCDLYRGVVTAIDTEHMQPYRWDDWIKLPVRECDRSVRTIHGQIRVPVVISSVSYDKMPKKKPKLSKRNRRKAIGERDGYVCQYTGRHAPDGNVDHKVARSKGGPNTWENFLWSAKEVNAAKGNLSVEEFAKKTGLKPRKNPQAPKEQPACALIKPRQDRPEWNKFLIRH
jgi:5-methylcytosine-specific restriction endonuclease McrA